MRCGFSFLWPVLQRGHRAMERNWVGRAGRAAVALSKHASGAWPSDRTTTAGALFVVAGSREERARVSVPDGSPAAVGYAAHTSDACCVVVVCVVCVPKGWRIWKERTARQGWPSAMHGRPCRGALRHSALCNGTFQVYCHRPCRARMAPCVSNWMAQAGACRQLSGRHRIIIVKCQCNGDAQRVSCRYLYRL